jgi:hypothetical protein
MWIAPQPKGGLFCPPLLVSTDFFGGMFNTPAGGTQVLAHTVHGVAGAQNRGCDKQNRHSQPKSCLLTHNNVLSLRVKPKRKVALTKAVGNLHGNSRKASLGIPARMRLTRLSFSGGSGHGRALL